MLPAAISATKAAEAGAGAFSTLTGIAQSILIALIGDLTIQVAYLVLVILIDAILGVMVANQNRSFNIGIFLRATAKKISVYFLIISLFNAADIMIRANDLMRWGAVVS